MNEATHLRMVLPRLPQVHEVILVDGGSSDDTVSVAHLVRPGIIVCTQSRRGRGNALATGFTRATGDIIAVFEADGSDDPADIARLVAELVGGADVARRSRSAAGGDADQVTATRRLGNRVLRTVFNRAFRARATDLCPGLLAFWADRLELLELPSVDAPMPGDGALLWGDGCEIETVVACRFAAAGARVAEVPSPQRGGAQAMSHREAIHEGIRVLRVLAVERRRAHHVWSTDAAVRPLFPEPVVDQKVAVETAREEAFPGLLGAGGSGSIGLLAAAG